MQKLRIKIPPFVLPAIITVLAALAIITLPAYPYIISEPLSEKAVLSYAHEKGWHFGTDVVFSYGPLGFLASRYFFSHAATLRFVVDVLLSLTVCAGVTRLAWQMKRTWRWMLIATFLFLGANIDPRYDLVLYLGVFSWGLLCFLDRGPSLAVAIGCLSALTAFGMLVKANFLFIAALTTPAIMADLWFRRIRMGAFGLGLATCGWFFAMWLAAGQGWQNLGPFFSHLPDLVSGYNATVALDGSQILRSRGFIAVALLAIGILFKACTVHTPENTEPRSSRMLNTRRVLVGCWLGGLLFLVWKHGFVRADWFHEGFFFGFVPFCAVALEALPSQESRLVRVYRILALSCWLVVLVTLQRWCFPALPSSLIQPFRTLCYNTSVLMRPGRFRAESLKQQDTAFSSFDLPTTRQKIGRASVDVFGENQLYALYNHLNYRPRPLFQTYMGYNASLDSLNERHFLSPTAPEYVLFQLTPLDHKFPPLEDPFVLRDLLLNYEFSADENACLLLKRNSIAPPRLALLKQATATIGERIDLGHFGETNLWMEIRVRPSARGRLRAFIYKPAVLRIAVWSGNSKATYRAPTPMLSAGFVASPLLMTGDDVRDFYTGRKLKRPEGYSVQPNSDDQVFWNEIFEYRIYAVNSSALTTAESIAGKPGTP